MHRLWSLIILFQVVSFSLKPSTIDGKCLVYGHSPAGNVCACPEKVVLWSIYWDIKNPKIVRTKLLTLLGTFSMFILSNMSKDIFKICSHIQKKTHNPNIIFKITVYCTKHTKNIKIYLKNQHFRKNETNWKNSKSKTFKNSIFIWHYVYVP